VAYSVLHLPLILRDINGGEKMEAEEVEISNDSMRIPVRDVMGDSGMAMAQIVGSVRYSDEDKARWSKLIADFNNLYYVMGVQTWGMMRWRGVSLLKPPTDMWTYQELICEIKPDLIIETGSYRGGSALFMRDILNMVHPSGRIISIDIDDKTISEKAKVPGIEFYKGSSVADETLVHVKATIKAYNCERVMVILDSDHSEPHVSKELDLYSPLVTVGSIIIIEDTSPQNNDPGPKLAVDSWSLRQRGFRKNVMAEKFMLTFCRDGFWERME
jgi:cephalosporin hydroxylase